MKINPIYQSQIQPDTKKSDAAQGDGSGFASLLDEISKPKNAEEKPNASIGASALAQSGLIGRMLAAGQVGNVTEAAKTPEAQLEHTLTMMEEYADALGDPARSLKELAPMADELGREGELLAQMGQALPADSPLKGLTNDTAVLATVESMKFKRGDFV